MSLISNGEGLDSRVHIRHNSQIKVDNLTLEADARATLGHTSVYTIANSLNISSNIEFSSIWKNTSVNAQSVNILSNNKNLLSKNTSINSPVINLSAPECNVSKLTVTGNSDGNCFDTSRPTAKLSRSVKEINAGESVSFSAKKSSDNLGITKYSFFVNSELIRSNQNPEFTHKFVESGIYYVKLVVEDADGYRASAQKKIIVNETLVKSGSTYFDYRIEDNNLSLIFHQMIPYEEITSAKYLITPLVEDEGVYEFPITNFYHRSEKSIGFLGDGEYKVGLVVTDIYNREFTYERIINYTGEESFYKESPVLEYEITQVAPKEIMVDFRKIFDPSDNLQWIDIEWGDGSVEEVNHVTSAFMKHKYSNVGDFEIKLIVAKEVDGEESLSETIRTISVTSDEVAALPPLIDYGILIEDFAPYVTFNLDRSISPNAEIVSVVFDHGDGSFYSGDSFVHTHFYDPGVYVTKLTVTDSNGLSVTQSSQVVITDPSENLVASLNCEQVDDPLNVECEAVAVDKFSELSEITLDWGDGNSQQIPLLQGEFTWDSFEHSYAEEGTYNVTLTVKNIRAETKSSQYSITIEENVDPVNQSPIASIYCQATGNIKEIMCDYSGSDDPDGYITNFNIKISDGSEFNFTNSSPIYHTFDGNGLYEILLTVTDNNGESSSSDTTIGLINQLPVVDVFCESNSIQEITCSSYSYDPDGYIVNTSFDWGEGSQSGTDTSFTANISTGGVTDVEVSIIDNEGEVSKEYRTVFVIENQKPYAGFSCESISNNNLSCTNSSYDPDGGELSYLWEINGQNYQSKNINIMINGNTVYQVSLKVVDIFGSEAIKTDSLSVKGNSTPFAMFNCNFTNFNEMSCLNTSGDPDGDALSYKWYVNDELHDAQVNLNYILRNGERGNIAVKLVVSDGIEEAEFVNNYYVNILPIAKFNCTQENSLVVRCSAEESLDDGAIEGYSWVVNGIDFYEGSFIEIPVNNFNLNTIDLTITDDSSEMATVSQSVKFYNLDLLPEARFTYVVDVGGKSILNAGESLIDGRKVAAFTWFVNGNEIENTEDSAIIYTFPSLGTYNVKLVIIDSQGRESETVKDIIVYDMEVSQPTYEDNSISLSGIDADNNGVRDDIQRAVNSYAKGNNSIKEHLGEYIKLNLGLISSLDDSVVTNSKYFKRRKAVRCIASLVPETEVSTLIQEIDVMSFNTRDRIEKWAVMKEMITDETLDREMEETEQVCTY